MLETRGDKDNLIEFKLGLSTYQLILIRNSLYELYRHDPEAIQLALHLQRIYAAEIGLALKGYELEEVELDWEELQNPLDFFEEQKLNPKELNKKYPDLEDPFNGWFFPHRETGKFVGEE